MDRGEQRPSGGLTVIVMACAAIGAAAVGRGALCRADASACMSADLITVPIQEPPPAGAPAPLSERMKTPRKPGPAYATEEYGRRLIASTAELLGPDQPDERLRYITSRLNCASCHLGTGTEPGTLTLLQTEEHYPRFSGRAGTQTDIEDRINECMQRSMNGKPLPMDSPEMIAMAAYLRSLGAAVLGDGASLRKAEEPPPFKTPARAASPEAGGETCSGRDARSATARTAWGCWRPRTGARAISFRRSGGPTRSTTARGCTAC